MTLLSSHRQCSRAVGQAQGDWAGYGRRNSHGTLCKQDVGTQCRAGGGPGPSGVTQVARGHAGGARREGRKWWVGGGGWGRTRGHSPTWGAGPRGASVLQFCPILSMEAGTGLQAKRSLGCATFQSWVPLEQVGAPQLDALPHLTVTSEIGYPETDTPGPLPSSLPEGSRARCGGRCQAGGHLPGSWRRWEIHRMSVYRDPSG